MVCVTLSACVGLGIVSITYPVGPENELIREWWWLGGIRVVALSYNSEAFVMINGEGFTLADLTRSQSHNALN